MDLDLQDIEFYVHEGQVIDTRVEDGVLKLVIATPEGDIIEQEQLLQ